MTEIEQKILDQQNKLNQLLAKSEYVTAWTNTYWLCDDVYEWEAADHVTKIEGWLIPSPHNDGKMRLLLKGDRNFLDYKRFFLTEKEAMDDVINRIREGSH